MIAVVGATGNTGRAVVRELRALGEDPVCVVRDAAKAREVLGEEAKAAVAELEDRAGLEAALEGVKRVFVVTGHNPQTAVQQINVLEAAKAAGADFFVKVSGGRSVVGPKAESIVGRCHHEIEQAMAASGLGWTILRPGLFMQNAFAQADLIKTAGKMVLPFARDLPIAFIDVRDTGALGARILRDPADHAGKTYEFTGKISNYETFAAVIGEVIGKPIAYVEASLEDAEKAMRGRGMPDWLVGHMLAIARAGAKGGFSTEMTGPVETIVGRPPITLRQFVEDHRGVFA